MQTIYLPTRTQLDSPPLFRAKFGISNKRHMEEHTK